MATHRIIDTDTHIVEAPDLWTSRLPKKWGDQVMHIEWDDKKGLETWVLGGQTVKAAWGGAAYGWSLLDFTRPPTQADCHPATWDQKERLKLMDEWGIEVAVLYPNVTGFTFGPFVHFPDPEISAAHVSAYNDWQLEWALGAPGRFIPMLAVPCWDIDRSVAEIERHADSGFGGIVTTGAPDQHGLPSLRDRHWDPMWRATELAGMSVSFHVANGEYQATDLQPGRVALEGEDIKEARVSTSMYLENAKQVTDLLLSGILPRFPELNFVAVESGMGWVPFILRNVDSRFVRNQVYKQHPEFGDLTPTDLFRRQCYVNFWFEELRQHHIDEVGLDNLLFETDFPHPTGIYNENFQDTLDLALGQVSDEVKQTILWANPVRLYRKALEKQGVLVGA